MPQTRNCTPHTQNIKPSTLKVEPEWEATRGFRLVQLQTLKDGTER